MELIAFIVYMLASHAFPQATAEYSCVVLGGTPSIMSLSSLQDNGTYRIQKKVACIKESGIFYIFLPDEYVGSPT